MTRWCRCCKKMTWWVWLTGLNSTWYCKECMNADPEYYKDE